MRPALWIVPLTGSLVAGCASIKSNPVVVSNDGNYQGSGVYYYMPRKDILVTLTVDDKHLVKQIETTTTAAYPDTSQPYLLSYDKNLVGKNTLDVQVTEQGLLTSADSTTTSGVSDALKALAADAGILSTLGKSKTLLPPGTPAPPPSPCADGTSAFLFDLEQVELDKEQPICGDTTVTISARPMSRVRGKDTLADAGGSGVYYRQNLAYLVAVSSKSGARQATIQFSPTQSAIHFLPITRTLFANNDGKLVLADGVLKQYTQSADGEAVALLKLPADILSSYFAAVGSLFDSFKSNDSKQADATTASLQLQLAQRKYDACVTAIKNNDTTTITTLGC